MSFAKDLQKYAKDTGQKLDDVCRAVTITLFKGVIQMTPVGNPSTWQSNPPQGYTGGSARANWQATIGSPATSVSSATDPSGGASISAVFTNVKGGQVNYLTNNLPYINRLEYGAWSNQAPAGMVRVSVRRVASSLATEVRKRK
jgi:hypothetical protein